MVVLTGMAVTARKADKVSQMPKADGAGCGDVVGWQLVSKEESRQKVKGLLPQISHACKAHGDSAR